MAVATIGSDGIYDIFGVAARYNLNKVTEYIICLSMVYFITSYAFTRRIPLSIVQVLWFIWIAYMILTALPQVFSSPFHLKHFLQIDLVVYTIPLFMIASPTLDFYKSLMKLAWIGVVVYVVSSLFVFSAFPLKSEGLTFLLGGGLPLLLMTLPYHSKSKSRVFYIALVIVLVLMMLLSRRNKVVYFGGALALALYINLTSKSSLSKARKYTYFFITAVVFVGFVMLSEAIFTDFADKMGTGMASREIVIDLFFDDFNRSPSDWIFGRGIFGMVDGGVNGDEYTGLRDGIENGYLTLILKGGWIWLGLLILTSIKSFITVFSIPKIFCVRDLL